MNFGTGSSNPPPPGTSSSYYNSYNPVYSPVYSGPSSNSSSSNNNFGYSPSSWPPPPPDAADDLKKDPGGAYAYNNGYGDSSEPPPAFRPPSAEKTTEGPGGEDDQRISKSDLIDNTNSSSPPNQGSEDSSSSPPTAKMEDEKKPPFRPPQDAELLSEFDDKQQELLSNNNNEEYHHLGGGDLEKPVGLPYDHPPNPHHDDWLAANQHLQQQGGSMQHGFPMGMGAYGQQQAQPQQPMWNYYNSYPAPPPHQDRFMESPWWNYGGHPLPPLQQQPQQTPPTSHSLTQQQQQPWAIRGPRSSPRGSGSERRGPGRPRLSASSNKGSPGDPSSPSGSSPRIPSSSPYPQYGEQLSPGEDPDRKRGPGRPRIGLDLDGSNILEELGAAGPPPAPPAPAPPPASGGKSKGSSGSTNSNKKRYVCEICQKRFSTAWYVRVHRKSHNGERPYICHNCGKGFMLPNVLQVHLRKCEKTAALRPEVRPANASPVLPPGGNSIVVGGEAGSPLPQQQQPHNNVPYPPPPPNDIYGGLYNQRFQPPTDSLGYGLIGGEQQAQQPGMPPLNNYVSGDSSIPGSSFPPPERSPYGSPLFSPSSHHFLANDRPPDKGGGFGPPPLSCTSCESLFDTQSSLEEHYPCPLLSACSFCDKTTTFSDKGDLHSHLLTSHGVCPVCSERFPFKSALLSHMETHHEKFMMENQWLSAEPSSGSGNTGLKGAILLESEEGEGTPNGGPGDLKLQHPAPLAMS